jgi:hypothetical protein
MTLEWSVCLHLSSLQKSNQTLSNSYPALIPECTFESLEAIGITAGGKGRREDQPMVRKQRYGKYFRLDAEKLIEEAKKK